MSGTTFENIEVVFENGALTSFTYDIVFCDFDFTVHCEFYNMGATVVELPTDYTDYS